jgi:glutamyl/glutaminyl-tRNA synthetase
MAPSLYRGRLAPSPTGLLHLGHASTFRTAQLRAESAGGTLLLRNEDLDPQRSRQEFVEAMIEDLMWLGIVWKPPMISQSGRTELYSASFDRLLRQGDVYPCKCSRKDLARMMEAPHEDIDDEPVYDGRCRPAEQSTSPGIIHGMNYRFRVRDSETINFSDGNLGPQCFTAGKDFGDFLIWRKDALPSYQLACVVDDASTNITEVVRGRDLLKSTARQILLQRSLGLPTPDYYHANLLTDEHGIRLAKRHDALAIRTLRRQGLTPAEVLQMAAASMTTVTSNS